jgi:CRP/FNR family cyclic AMP-dependent transcriptional regulator
VGVGAIAAELKKVPLFAGCSQRDLQAVAHAVREVNHKAGTVIAREGEPGIGLFVVREGRASVSIGGVNKGTINPGEFFGEIALLDGGPRTATVTAVTDMKLLGLTEWVFRGLVQRHPSIAIKTLQAMAARLRKATKAATV